MINFVILFIVNLLVKLLNFEICIRKLILRLFLISTKEN